MLALHPLDVVKTRLQGPLHARLASSVRHFAPVRHTCSLPQAQWLCKAADHRQQSSQTAPPLSQPLTGEPHSGCIAAVQDGAARGALPLYRGTRDAVRCMIQQEGWRSLYGGLSPALLGAGIVPCRQSKGMLSSGTVSFLQGMFDLSFSIIARSGGPARRIYHASLASPSHGVVRLLHLEVVLLSCCRFGVIADPSVLEHANNGVYSHPCADMQGCHGESTSSHTTGRRSGTSGSCSRRSCRRSCTCCQPPKPVPWWVSAEPRQLICPGSVDQSEAV